MSASRLKIEVARAALKYVEEGMVLGVGTGSTVNAFIDELASAGIRLDGAVSSSEQTTERLKKIGVSVKELNHTGDLDLYIDGADEIDGHKRLIKGGGGALTREKVIAGASRKFVCIADDSKRVEVLGEFPLPVEVIPMARSFVARQLRKLGGQPELREGFTTDNGNVILDIAQHGPGRSGGNGNPDQRHPRGRDLRIVRPARRGRSADRVRVGDRKTVIR